jgi:hypothetical protein
MPQALDNAPADASLAHPPSTQLPAAAAAARDAGNAHMASGDAQGALEAYDEGLRALDEEAGKGGESLAAARSLMHSNRAGALAQLGRHAQVGVGAAL